MFKIFISFFSVNCQTSFDITHNLLESPMKFYCILHLLIDTTCPTLLHASFLADIIAMLPNYKGGINIFSIQVRVSGLGIWKLSLGFPAC